MLLKTLITIALVLGTAVAPPVPTEMVVTVPRNIERVVLEIER